MQSRLLSDCPAGGHTTGNRHCTDARVCDHRRHRFALNGNINVETLRSTRIANQGFQRQSAALYRLGMLHHDCVSHQRSGNEEAQHLPEREIPGHDRQHRAKRFINHSTRCSGNGFRLDIRRAFASEMPRAESCLLHFAQRFADRLTHLERDQTRVIVCARFQQLCQTNQKCSPLRKRSAGPLLPSIPAALQADLKFLRSMLRVSVQKLTSSRISRLECHSVYPFNDNGGTSNQRRSAQLFIPSSANWTPFAPSSKSKRQGLSSTT